MFEIESYREMSKLPRSKKYEYAAYWQQQRENGAELQYSNLATMMWQDDDQDIEFECIYRLKPKPEMVDLDFSDYLDIANQWLINTRSGEKCLINYYDQSDTFALKIQYSSRKEWITFADLRKHYTYADGRRLEKEMKQTIGTEPKEN